MGGSSSWWSLGCGMPGYLPCEKALACTFKARARACAMCARAKRGFILNCKTPHLRGCSIGVCLLVGFRCLAINFHSPRARCCKSHLPHWLDTWRLSRERHLPRYNGPEDNYCVDVLIYIYLKYQIWIMHLIFLANLLVSILAAGLHSSIASIGM